MTSEQYFRDENPWQGWVEANTPQGWMRWGYRGSGAWDVYQHDGDGYRKICTISVPRHYCRPRALYNASERAFCFDP